ncbi:hypothetical protein [Silvanigrella aquatica]|uniref:Type II secretion system protein GspG C-terminal domain-containing protein n=1 Tax=Silvanigrella aquatica TaxID=1915309 RepID=A0A1L4D1R8_9BACT|nr:hypothetical protein [Silvanigrella aquatica]APJ04155.1 hypothetical protein AXG55_09655 [Silvanigrella aquatica]
MLLRKKSSNQTHKIAGYTTFGILGMIVLIACLSFIVLPKISIFKAKGQQSEARIKLVRIYNSMYAYKLENGNFINTNKNLISVVDLRELYPYLKDDVLIFSSKNDKVFILSNSEKFVAAYIRVLSNGNYDIQRINSKKKSCFMLNGTDKGTENCDPKQNYNEFSSIDDQKDIKKLNILDDD